MIFVTSHRFLDLKPETFFILYVRYCVFLLYVQFPFPLMPEKVVVV